MNKPPDKNYYKSIKVPLKSIIKYDHVQNDLTDIAIKGNKIIIHTLQFIKLFCIKQYDTTKTLPIINDDFINSIMKSICHESVMGRPPSEAIQALKDTLKKFYNDEFKMLNVDTNLDYVNMSAILNYLTIDVKTMFDNNVKMRYIDYVERFVNVFWEKKARIESIQNANISKKLKDEKIRFLCSRLRKVKNDLLNVEDYVLKSDEVFHAMIKQYKKLIVPDKTIFQKNSVYYDLQCNPDDYFICMYRMAWIIEGLGFKIYNLFPMRTEIIPKHLKIDTTSIVNILVTKNKGFFRTEGNLKKNEDKIWKFFFRTELSCFKKKNYSFHHMICTDGISCSILLIRNDMIGKRIPTNKKKGNNEKYIDELENKDYKRLKDKTIVAIDPNKGDLIYCVDDVTKERNQFRYTQDQRRNETKSKKYQKIILEKKQEKIEGKTITQWETELSLVDKETELSIYDKKTLNFIKFKNYLLKKNEINKRLYPFYEKEIFRKLRLNGYINRLRSEQMMINNFIEKFGQPEETIICFGDWDQKKQMKYKEPTKGKGFRNLFRQNGFDVYLVDEFRTSCRCSVCEGECETFRECENPRPWKKGTKITRHGLLRCKTCKVLWNRDENSSNNIHKISKCAINKKLRPKYLSRQKNED